MFGSAKSIAISVEHKLYMKITFATRESCGCPRDASSRIQELSVLQPELLKTKEIPK